MTGEIKNMNLKKKVSFSLITSMMLVNSCFAFPVDFSAGTPVVEAVRALGYKAGRNVVINGDLKGTIAMHMDDTTFDTALKAMSIAGNFSYDYVGSTVLVAPQNALKTMETFKLEHLEPDVFAKQMGLIVDESNVVVNNLNHTIAVKGSSGELARVRDQIEQLDVAQQQVNIKATVVEISKSKTRDIGLSYLSDVWTKDTSVSGYNGFKFSITGHHEEVLGNGNVLARPNITTFDGKKATILMGDKVPVFTSSSDGNDTDSDASLSVEYKEVGVKLDVLPRINEDDKETITMVIKPSVSTISQWVESGNNKAPQISERSAETTVRVKSGETILIGGLLKDEELKTIKQVPLLSKIPFFGELFKSRSIDKKNTEIVIAITPTIIYDNNGRPQVELQKTTPSLHNKLSELQQEKEVSNLDTESQKNLDTEKEGLEKHNQETEKLLKEREEELRTLRADKQALEKELRASNESMKNILKSIKKAGE